MTVITLIILLLFNYLLVTSIIDVKNSSMVSIFIYGSYFSLYIFLIEVKNIWIKKTIYIYIYDFCC